jgi:hypothetical protein
MRKRSRRWISGGGRYHIIEETSGQSDRIPFRVAFIHPDGLRLSDWTCESDLPNVCSSCEIRSPRRHYGFAFIVVLFACTAIDPPVGLASGMAALSRLRSPEVVLGRRPRSDPDLYSLHA